MGGIPPLVNNRMKEKFKIICLGLLDFPMALLSIIFLPLYKLIQKYSLPYFPLTRKSFLKSEIYPIPNHYYFPQFIFSNKFKANKPRPLKIDFNLPKQITNLTSLQFSNELSRFPKTGTLNAGSFYLNNPSFGAGDADLYYLIIRNIQPKKIIEIGSGYTSLLALAAMEENNLQGATTSLTCIEPFEMKWLEEKKQIHLIRERIENVSLDLFSTLEENDILFIDSSHIVRPENDVLFEYLEILPSLKKGVIIHIHDIFSPRHYPASWMQEELRLWNEQYLLEAFLYYNESFEIMYSLNHLKTDAFEPTRLVLTNLNLDDNPGSFWMRKIK